MQRLNLHHPWSVPCGILGNILSLIVYLAPVPTFHRIRKRKSTEGFQSLPYVVALFSSMLWIYYALTKTNSHLIITINSVGCLIEIVYIAMFVFYAPKKEKIFSGTVFLLLNVIGFGSIVLCTRLFAHGARRVNILGWICAGFSIAVFASPLSIIGRVMRTKSVEFVPLYLSVSLSLSAVAWLLYGIFEGDIYIELPNILGIVFGILQMVIYMCYKDSKDRDDCRQAVLVVNSRGDREVHPFDRRSDARQEPRACEIVSESG